MLWQQKTIAYEREGLAITIEGIWLWACPACGHESVPGPLAIQIMNMADQLLHSAKQLQMAAALPLPRVCLTFPPGKREPPPQLQPA
jgi:hypothetical protein